MTALFVDIVSSTAVSDGSVDTGTNATHAAGHLYLATISLSPDMAVDSVGGMGLAWSLVRAQCGGGGDQRVEVWQAIGGAGGSDDVVTAAITGTADALAISVARYSGADLGGPIGASVGHNSNGLNGACSGGASNDDATGSITTTVADSLVVAAFGTHEATLAATSGWTTRLDDLEAGALVPPDVTASIEEKAVASPGATTIGASNNLSAATDSWCLVAVEILAAPVPPEPMAAGPLDVEVELYNTDWTLARRLETFDGFELVEREDGTATLKLKVPFEDVPAAIYASGGRDCPIVVYIRGVQRFGSVGGAGIIVAMDDEDREGGAGSPSATVIDVTIEAITDWQWHLGKREVKGTGGARYSQSTVSPLVAMRNLINANCKTGSVIEPAEYATLGTSGVDRDNFGPHNVQGATSGAHPDTIDSIRWPHGESLYHSIAEGCRRHDCRAYATWDRAASPKPLMTVTVAYPRLGDDLTSGPTQVRFSRETTTLERMGRKVDHQKGGNVAEVQGKSVRANQPKGYAIAQDDYDANGLDETGDLVPDGWQDDVDEEAAFVIAQVGGGATTHAAILREKTGMTIGVDCDLGDKIAIDDSKRDILVEDWISEIVWTHSGKGPLGVAIKLGREELSDASRGGRSGGGRSGSGRKGGKPKPKAGEPETVRKVVTNTGDIEFVQVDSEWELKGEEGVDRIRPVHFVVADPDDEDTPKETQVFIEGDVFTPCVACTGYMWIWAANLGRNVKVLVTDPGPGGGGDGGPTPGG